MLHQNKSEFINEALARWINEKLCFEL